MSSWVYFLSHTCSDIAFTAMSLEQHNLNLTHKHLLAMKHVLQYLLGIQNYALEYNFSWPSSDLLA